MSAPSIVFVHGMYLNGLSWEPWITRAAARGNQASAPSWPFHDGDPPRLRSRVDPHLGDLTFGAVVDHLRGIVAALPVPPILIGHSVGGLVVQKLINEGFGVAGVAICPAPPAGVFVLDRDFVRANFPHVNPFAGNRPVIMTPERFHYTFGNTMTRADSDAALERLVVPESRNVPRSTLTRQGRIDFGAAHAPLLIIAADHDHLVPRALVEKNARAYRGSSGVLDYRSFPARSHFACNQDGWEEIADFAFDWVGVNSGQKSP
jgi:pimeloyl-ACP methyl ester carboxylesterase